MRFDEFWEDQPPAPESLPMPPDGTHFATIVDATEKKLKFVTANPQGLALVLVLSIRECQPFEAIVPVNWRGKIEAVCKAAGIKPPTPSEEWDEKSLIGRNVSVKTLHAVSNSGREYVKVERWLESPSQPLTADKPARTPAAKAAKQFKANATPDDIPF